MAVPNSITEQIDNLYTTTWQHMREEGAVDNIFEATPFYFWLRDNDRIKFQEGGRFIEETLVYKKNDDVVWLGKGGTVTLQDREILTGAYYIWHYIVAPITRFGVDDQKNRGRMQIINLASTKLENAQDSLVDTLEIQLFAGAGSDGGPFDGLLLLVANDPTTSVTVGGINQQTYDWWRNKFKDMTGISFSSAGVQNMRTMMNNCSRNKGQEKPDILVTNQTIFEYYEEAVFDKYQIHNQKLTDLGFENMVFKGSPMIWNPSAPSSIYFLNTKYIKMVADPGYYFDMTEWKPIPNQVNDRAAQIISAITMTTNRRRAHGVMHTINTP